MVEILVGITKIKKLLYLEDMHGVLQRHEDARYNSFFIFQMMTEQPGKEEKKENKCYGLENYGGKVAGNTSWNN